MSIVVDNQVKLHRISVWLIVKKLTKQLGISKYTISGSYRRGKTWCNDIDLLIPINSPAEKLGLITLVLKAGWELRSDRQTHENIFSYQFIKKTRSGVIVLDLFLADPGCMGNALVFTTGPRDFNDIIRGNIVETGYTWTNPQYFTHIKSNNNLSFSEELSVFKFLGIKWIRPKRRK